MNLTLTLDAYNPVSLNIVKNNTTINLDLVNETEILELAIEGIGIQGPPGSSQEFEHLQTSPSNSWTINHNFGRTPSNIRVLSSNGFEIDASIQEINLNQIIVSFSSAQTGKVLIT